MQGFYKPRQAEQGVHGECGAVLALAELRIHLALCRATGWGMAAMDRWAWALHPSPHLEIGVCQLSGRPSHVLGWGLGCGRGSLLPPPPEAPRHRR